LRGVLTIPCSASSRRWSRRTLRLKRGSWSTPPPAPPARPANIIRSTLCENSACIWSRASSSRILALAALSRMKGLSQKEKVEAEAGGLVAPRGTGTCRVRTQRAWSCSRLISSEMIML
jgi:hypothetical protein